MLDYLSANWFWILFIGGTLFMVFGHGGHGGHGHGGGGCGGHGGHAHGGDQHTDGHHEHSHHQGGTESRVGPRPGS